jgi:putative tryptophan/tyrosine transport system substrate-binding protein
VSTLEVACRVAVRCVILAGAAYATMAIGQAPAKAPAKSSAPTVAKSYRIGVLSQGNPPSNEIPGADYRQGLKDWGYVNGANVSVEFRYGGGNADKLPDLALELVKMNIDVIVTVGDSAAFAAKKATASIPVVATEFGVDPVKTELVTSLARPTGNVTGLSSISDELWTKRLGLLRELVPRLGRVTVLWNSGNPGNVACVAQVRAAGREMNVHLVALEVTDANSVERAFSTITKDKPDALALCWDSVTLEYAHAVGDFAIRQRLPIVAPLREYVKAGALVSFGTSLAAHRRRAAYYTDKIIKGAKPADLPVERPTHFELVVNLATAKALGIAMPAVLMAVADELIE